MTRPACPQCGNADRIDTSGGSAVCGWCMHEFTHSSAKPLRVLVACEFSGTVRDAFLARGHDAWSCDLLPAETNSNRHIQGDVREVLHWGWDLLMVAHPPCFAADTLVLTSNGYKPIADIRAGDLVLTHLGRWRRVTDTMRKEARKIVRVKSTNNLETVTTPEHPYYARFREPYRNLFRTKEERDRGPPEFVDAADLTTRHFTCSVLPPTERVDISHEDLWLMGRYVADGHMRNSRWTDGKYEEMVISVGRHEATEFLAKVHRKVTMHESGTAIKATFYGHDAIAPFAQFGRSANTKALPGWVLALPQDQAASFLDGYISGDGHYHQRRTETVSTSKALTLGVALLMQRVHNKCPALNTLPPRGQSVIQGRIVNNNTQYRTAIPVSNTRLRNYVDGIYAWGHVRSVATFTETTTVYNLSVEEDETYTANGVVVHNCTRLCNSGVRWLSQPPPGKTLTQMWAELEEAAALFSDCWNAPIERVCIENPVMHRHAKERIRNYRPFAQSIQPWQFGHGETKRTCLWLRNLPVLKPTNIVPGRAQRVHRMGPGKDRWRERSRFFKGVAEAMASQWGDPNAYQKSLQADLFTDVPSHATVAPVS